MMDGSTGREVKATTVQDRMDILAEVVESRRDIMMEWGDRWPTDAEEGILHGAQVRLVWQSDGTAIVRVDDEVVGRVEVEISARFVEHLDAVNEPIGGVMDRTWGTVPSGWFVQTPKGQWLEVGPTSLQAGGVQHVCLTIGGKAVVFPRDPAGPVKARRGSLSPALRDDALSALESAFTTAVLNDEGPMQS